MATNIESLENFKEKINELVNCKYILAERKISDLLKVITDSKMLYELFEYVTDGFDYYTFKSVCFPEDGNGVKMPAKESELLALVFLLLMEIDMNKESLDGLCLKYFGANETGQARYASFVLKVIIPFGLATERAADRLINAQNEELSAEKEVGGKAEKIATESESEPPKAEVKKAPEKKEYPFIEKARKVAEKYYKGRSIFKRNREKKEELDYILFSLENALRKKNAETVTLAYTALKYFVLSEFNLKINLDEIMKGISEEV